MAKHQRIPGKAAAPRPRRALAGALALFLAIPLAAPATAGQEAATQAPDFSAVTTRTIASRLVRKRQLVKIHLVPIELGGPNNKVNIVYVTPFPLDVRASERKPSE